MLPIHSSTRLLSHKTVDDDAMGLAELHNLAWIKATGKVDLFKPWMVKEMKDVAQVSRIPGVI